MTINFNITKSKLYVILVTIAALAVIGFFVFRYSSNHASAMEHFTPGGDGDNENAHVDYNSRLNVINVFDTYLKRNPTPSEINNYSKLKNEQDILSAVIKDFPNPNPKPSPQHVLNAEELNMIEEETIVQAEEMYEDDVKSDDKDYVRVKRSDLSMFLMVLDEAKKKVKAYID